MIDTPDGSIGYGNISVRFPGSGHPPRFIISGSQTGHLAQLDRSHFTLVDAAFPEENRLVSRGPVKSSSESLTHAVIYQQDPGIHWVLHAHHKPLWQAAERLGIPLTSPDATYGTPEMAVETARLFADTNVREMGIFAMAGHEDGIVSFSETAGQAAEVMANYLGLAEQN